MSLECRVCERDLRGIESCDEQKCPRINDASIEQITSDLISNIELVLHSPSGKVYRAPFSTWKKLARGGTAE